MAIKVIFRLRTLFADEHLIEVKYCDDTRPEQQPARAIEQHIRLIHAFAQQCHTASLHTIIDDL